MDPFRLLLLVLPGDDGIPDTRREKRGRKNSMDISDRPISTAKSLIPRVGARL